MLHLKTWLENTSGPSERFAKAAAEWPSFHSVKVLISKADQVTDTGLSVFGTVVLAV